MNILLLGSGGREHAIASKIAESPRCTQLFIAPGNAGTQLVGTNTDLNASDFEAVATFVSQNAIKMVVIGPEQPLAEGLVDFLDDQGIPAVGPRKAGAQLESSKEFSKDFMARHDVPTAAFASFGEHEMELASAYIRSQQLPVVVKASGLAAGKGVLICDNHADAIVATEQMLRGDAFGDSGKTVVIEEFLKGIECSVFVLTDGKDYKILPVAKDYKRIGEGDTGLNTGGMGAVTPVPFADATFMEKVETRIIQPTLSGLQTEEIPFKGFLFIGLMSVAGEPYVIEYNVRMGDPETEVVFPMIDSDIVEAFEALLAGNLSEVEFRTRPGHCMTVFLVSGGYPGSYEKGKAISGLENVVGSHVFHAGTRLTGDQVLTNGGRVLAITSIAETLEAARNMCYENVEKVNFEGKNFRRDIGLDLLP